MRTHENFCAEITRRKSELIKKRKERKRIALACVPFVIVLTIFAGTNTYRLLFPPTISTPSVNDGSQNEENDSQNNNEQTVAESENVDIVTPPSNGGDQKPGDPIEDEEQEDNKEDEDNRYEDVGDPGGDDGMGEDEGVGGDGLIDWPVGEGIRPSGKPSQTDSTDDTEESTEETEDISTDEL